VKYVVLALASWLPKKNPKTKKLKIFKFLPRPNFQFYSWLEESFLNLQQNYVVFCNCCRYFLLCWVLKARNLDIRLKQVSQKYFLKSFKKSVIGVRFILTGLINITIKIRESQNLRTLKKRPNKCLKFCVTKPINGLWLWLFFVRE